MKSYTSNSVWKGGWEARVQVGIWGDLTITIDILKEIIQEFTTVEKESK